MLNTDVCNDHPVEKLREHTEIISKGWLTSNHMTAHMIQPPDQVDDIIQRDYTMSPFPTHAPREDITIT